MINKSANISMVLFFAILIFILLFYFYFKSLLIHYFLLKTNFTIFLSQFRYRYQTLHFIQLMNGVTLFKYVQRDMNKVDSCFLYWFMLIWMQRVSCLSFYFTEKRTETSWEKWKINLLDVLKVNNNDQNLNKITSLFLLGL